MLNAYQFHKACNKVRNHLHNFWKAYKKTSTASVAVVGIWHRFWQRIIQGNMYWKDMVGFLIWWRTVLASSDATATLQVSCRSQKIFHALFIISFIFSFEFFRLHISNVFWKLLNIPSPQHWQEVLLKKMSWCAAAHRHKIRLQV